MDFSLSLTAAKQAILKIVQMDSVVTLNAIVIVESDLNSVLIHCNQSVTSGSGDKNLSAS